MKLQELNFLLWKAKELNNKLKTKYNALTKFNPKGLSFEIPRGKPGSLTG